MRRRSESIERSSSTLVAASTNGHTARSTTAANLAKGLGWFSIGLGLAELLAPREVARLIGAKGTARAHATLRILGVRELISGVGILSGTRDATWVWSRLGGDIMDVALLKAGRGSSQSDRARGLAATAVALGVAAMDGLTALELSRETAVSAGAFTHPINVTVAVTINRPINDVYEFWRNLENLPHVLSHVEAVRIDGDQSHWRAKLPAGLELEWSAELEEDKPGELISWRSLPGGALQNHGRVSFKPAPGERGTEVHVLLGFEPLGGAAGAAFAKLFGSLPTQQLRADLKRVKQLLETGSVMRSDASVHCGPHPARPARTRDNGKGASQ
jgi:uncharacterized membrane protein